MRDSNKIKVFITVDIEPSIGGAFSNRAFSPIGSDKRVYCRINGKSYGIPLIMDILDNNDLKASFFVEVLNKFYFGEDEFASVCECVLRRGHDVQLHVHPNYLNFKDPNWPDNIKRGKKFSDILAHYSYKEQAELIAEGKELLKKYGVKSIVAFRAGGFGANNDTLEALKMNNFFIDSSYNMSFLGKTCFLSGKYNDAVRIGTIIEFPITNFLELKVGSYQKFKPLDICAVSYYEVKKILDYSRCYGPQNITFILHSFSFIKTKDVQYNKITPNFIVIRRFQKLCSFLNQNSDRFEVLTFSNFYEKYHKDGHFQTSKNCFPYIGVMPAFFRKVVQLVQRI